MKKKILFFIVLIYTGTLMAQQKSLIGTYKLSYTQTGEAKITDKNKDSLLEENIKEALALLEKNNPEKPTKEEIQAEIKYQKQSMAYNRSITYILTTDSTYSKKMLEVDGTKMEIVESGKYIYKDSTKQGMFYRFYIEKTTKGVQRKKESTDFVYDQKQKMILLQPKQSDQQDTITALQKVK